MAGKEGSRAFFSIDFNFCVLVGTHLRFKRLGILNNSDFVAKSDSWATGFF